MSRFFNQTPECLQSDIVKMQGICLLYRKVFPTTDALTIQAHNPAQLVLSAVCSFTSKKGLTNLSDTDTGAIRAVLYEHIAHGRNTPTS